MAEDPFENYYKEALGREPVVHIPANDFIEAGVESLAEAKLISGPINKLISNMNKSIADSLADERSKGTKQDLTMTLIIGGLAFTMANVYLLLSKDLGTKLTEESYKRTFLHMYESALRDMKDEKE